MRSDSRLDGTFYQEPIEQLYRELDARRLVFRPHFWLSDEWFTPDGVPGIAVLFYLCAPAVGEAGSQPMLEVEGGTHDWCMRILRHEAGHAIENAFCCAVAAVGRNSSAAPQPYPPEYYTPGPIAGVSSATWMSGTPRAIRMKTLPKRLPCGWMRVALEGALPWLAGPEEAGFHGTAHG